MSFGNVALDGVGTLEDELRAFHRKPRGYADGPGVDDLLSSVLAAPEARPTQQTSIAKFFGAAPSTSTSSASTSSTAAPPPAATTTEADAEGDPDDDGGEPSWVAAGGSTLEVLAEMMQMVHVRDGPTLFTEPERQWMRALAGDETLSIPARALFARLFARRGVAFAVGSLKYAEVGSDPLGAAAELQAAGLVRLVGPGSAVGQTTAGSLPPLAASHVIELLRGEALRDAVVAAGLPHNARPPLATRPKGGSEAPKPSDSRVAWLRDQLRLKLALPSLGGSSTTSSTSTTSTSTSTYATSGARLRDAQRFAVLRRVFSLLGPGPVVLLAEAPLVALLRAERLFLFGSFCSGGGTSAAAASVMGCSTMRAPSYPPPTPHDLPPCPPSRDALLRYEAAQRAASSFVELVTAAYREPQGSAAHVRPDALAALFEACLRILLRRAAALRPRRAAADEERSRHLEELLSPAPVAAAPPPRKPLGAMSEAFDDDDAFQQPRRAACSRNARAAAAAATVAASTSSSSVAPDAAAQQAEDDAARAAAAAGAAEAADAAAASLCAAAGLAQCGVLHAAEAEGWEALHAARPLAARMCLGWVCCSVLTVQVAALEKRRMHAAAAALLRLLLLAPFCAGRRGHWWVRLCIDTEHQVGRRACATLVGRYALAALADRRVAAGSRADLVKRARRLLLKADDASDDESDGDDVAAVPNALVPPPLRTARHVLLGARALPRSEDANAHAGGRVRYIAYTEDAAADVGSVCTVETLALQEYAALGWEGVHCETGVYSALFALLCWDLLFGLGPPDAFRSRFQDAPLDLFAGNGEFAAARRAPLDDRLAQLAATDGEALCDEVVRAHRAHEGTRAVGMHWGRWADAEQLGRLAGCLGGRALAAIFGAFAEDYHGWRGGMPDLLLWVAHDEAQRAAGAPFGEARLVEVKSPSDSLSHQQRAWIDLLLGAAVRVDELRVLPDVATDYDEMRPSFAPTAEAAPSAAPPQDVRVEPPPAADGDDRLDEPPTAAPPPAPPPESPAVPPAVSRAVPPSAPRPPGSYHVLRTADLDADVLNELPPLLRAEVLAEVAAAAPKAPASSSTSSGSVLPEKRRRGSDSKLRLKKRPAQ